MTQKFLLKPVGNKLRAGNSYAESIVNLESLSLSKMWKCALHGGRILFEYISGLNI